MSKAQKSFSEKAKTKGTARAEKRQVRVIRSMKDPQTGTVKFLDRMESVPPGGNLDESLSKLVQGKG